MAIGLWAPKILVPLGLCDRLSEDEFIQIVLHEIGHIERRDDWSNLLAQSSSPLTRSIHSSGW
jgi:beta-lactamase regulating signal transducer with metallopeptidase domain